MRVAAIELGGTNAIVSVGSGPDDLAEPVTIRTTDAEGTLAAVCDSLSDFRGRGWDFEAIGIAAFGPLELHLNSPAYGNVLPTPKPGWSGCNIVNRMRRAFDVPIGIETDVNGAALGEAQWGASRRLAAHAYVTVGTGVGIGVVHGGRPLLGLMHPEAGHLRVRRAPRLDPFEGVCRWHGDCLEGLISGVALTERLAGADPENLDPTDPIWALVGGYLGEALASVTLVASPERIVLGGGVGRRPEVLSATRQGLVEALGGYLPAVNDKTIGSFLVAPQLGSRSGLLGAVCIGERVRPKP